MYETYIKFKFLKSKLSNLLHLNYNPKMLTITKNFKAKAFNLFLLDYNSKWNLLSGILLFSSLGQEFEDDD